MLKSDQYRYETWERVYIVCIQRGMTLKDAFEVADSALRKYDLIAVREEK